MLSKRIVNQNIIIDYSKYPNSNSSNSEPKLKTTKPEPRKRKKPPSVESLADSTSKSLSKEVNPPKKQRQSPPPSPFIRKHSPFLPSSSQSTRPSDNEILDIKPIYTEIIEPSSPSESSDNQTISTWHNKGVITKQFLAQLQEHAAVSWDSGNTIWIVGIPDSWLDNLYVNKKLTTAIKNRFDHITVDRLMKDTYFKLWALTVGSTSEVKQMIGQTLQIEGKGTKMHTLTFLGVDKQE